MTINYGYGVELDTLNGRNLEQIRGWRNDPSIWKWCRQNSLITEIAHKEWWEWQAKDPATQMFVIRDTNLVGVTGLTSIDLLNRRAEFSLYVAPNVVSTGVGKRALRTLLDHGFLNLGLHLIWGEVFDGNPALEKFEGIGFKHEGKRRDFYFRDGKFIDAHLISMKAREWKALSSTPST